MEQVKDFFYGLFSTDLWPPRWYCGTWSDFLGWLYIISDLLIWLSYFLIPVIIINYLSQKGSALKFNKTYLYFAAFILFCGLTHLIDAMMFWVPMYRVNALLKFATAIVSMLTVYHLIKILPSAFSQKTSIELEQEIARRILAENRLQNANQKLERFASMASHDLQEPLRKISTFTSMLKDSTADKLEPRNMQQIDKISSAAVRMQSLINDILKLSSTQEEVVLQPTDPKISLEQSIIDLELKIAEKEALINYSELPIIAGNEVYLTQLFLNLIGNALKFNTEKPIITISGRQEGDLVFISISDNGIGIEPSYFPKIFEAFERLHTTSSYEGTGIGLTICRNIMKAHKGSISVRSIPGEGTTFDLTFLAVTNKIVEANREN